jgi:hypothetical protein
MKHKTIAIILGAVLALGAFAAQAKLPAPPAKSDADKAAEAAKAKADADKEAALLGKYQDKAVSNYKRGAGAKASHSSQSGKK